MQDLPNDFRAAARALVRRPGLTAAIILTLALGLGANAAIFSFVNTLLLQPLPFAEPDRIVQVWERKIGEGSGQGQDNVVSPANFADWAKATTSFEDFAGYWRRPAPLRGDGPPEEVQVTIASASFLDVLGLEPEEGRFLGEADVEEGQFAGDFAVLSHAFWQRRFGGDPGVVGETITVWTSPVTVVGVAPPELELFAPATEILLPTHFDWATRQNSGRFIEAVARLAPGVTLAGAQAEMSTIASRLESEYSDFNAGWGVHLKPLTDEMVGGIRPALLVFLGAVGLLLLVAMANVANLLLARAAERRREMAMRAALGAGSWRIFRQLLVESLVLVIAAAGFGAVIAVAAIAMLRKVAVSTLEVPRLAEVSLDGRVLLFMGALVMLTTLFFGMVPALGTRSMTLAPSLREGGRGMSRRSRTQQALVVVEIALALVLVTGAGLLIRSFTELRRVDPGIEVEGILTARVMLQGENFQTPESRSAFYKEAQEKLAALPGIRSASAIQWLPFSGQTSRSSYFPEDRPRPASGEEAVAGIRYIMPGYFKTVGMPVLDGRAFDERDQPDSTQVVVINQEMADLHWKGHSPIGKSLSYRWGDDVSVTVVGVVGDVHHKGVDEAVFPALFRPYTQDPDGSLNLVLRTEVPPSTLHAAVTRTIQEMDSTVLVSRFKTLAEYHAGAFSEPRLYTLLMAFFSGLALILAVFGIYGLISYSVSLRVREIGVRMAMGAVERDVTRLILGDGLKLAALGVALGLAAATALSRLLESLLFGIGALDPLTFVLVPCVLLMTATLASLVPARRASCLDPNVALDSD